MTGRLDYAKARRKATAYQAIRQHGPGEAEPSRAPRAGAICGWRTEWDGEEFPVIVTKIEPKEKAA